MLGVLLEKQRTTPEAYPLSVNALRLACNQSTNRDPVVEYDDRTVLDALEHLSRRRWARLASGAGSRARKYRHLVDRELELGEPELAVLCVLMLRGPQTPGELRQRTDRLHRFADTVTLEDAVRSLADRELVRLLPRRPGQKEQRYEQLLGGGVEPAEEAGEPAQGTPSPAPPTSDRDRLERLESEVARLRRDLTALREELGT